jgi:lysophospholipid acyltransferase (LPLAT)-like uncharacterized protein
MLSSRRIAQTPAVQKAIGVLAAEYLRLVWWTNRLVLEPADFYERVAPELPVIVGFWHGQHFMTPFLRRGHKVKVLISRHRDGEINAIAAKRLGIGTIRGSGTTGGSFVGKGGVSAFTEMLRALEEGFNVAVTADVPKLARIVGPGIIKLASASTRPIYPVAMATKRRLELASWDRAVINLPFTRGAGVVGAPVRVSAQADASTLESARRALQASLDSVTARAYAIVDRPQGDGDRV